ncbi:DUF2274 domain-containing protein [Nitrobacter sp.]|uniref:DUF2274 domain-containing protein n=1 Tax=Nitrobacter sp. TaxID=29420 RepID=UPI0029CAB354|nr:DUF2274 domain-containing protein [Nitrobacter sp.]
MTAKLKLGPLPDERPVKMTIELPAVLHADLQLYGRLLAETGSTPIEPARLIVPMLQRFIAADRGFAKARRETQSRIAGKE